MSAPSDLNPAEPVRDRGDRAGTGAGRALRGRGGQRPRPEPNNREVTETGSSTRHGDAPALPLWAAVITAAVAGLAMDAAFPSLGWWPLAFVAIALSLLTLIGRSVPAAMLVGGVFGAGLFFPHLSWVTGFLADHDLAAVPWAAVAGAESVLVAVLSPLITIAYRPTRHGHAPGWLRVLGLPLLVAGAWTVRELVIGSWPYGGFPWTRVGMTQAGSPFAQVASWTGVSGLGFLMVAVSAGVLEAIRPHRSTLCREGRERQAGRRQVALGISVVTAALMLVIPQFPTVPAGTVRVGAAQGNGPAAYADDRRPGEVLDAQLAASEPLQDERVDLVVWPEGGVDSDPVADPRVALILNDAAASYGAPILLNAASADGDAVYNRSFLWTMQGPAGTHAKRHPVPFGEYLPDRWLFEALAPDLVGLLGREYVPGTDVPVIDVHDVATGVAICFDVVFDDVIREGAHNGAQVYMLQTNNADFRGTDENLQQLAFARMRAIETGRSVVNLSTTGTSQVFSPDGTVLASLPVDEPGVMIADVELRDGLTAGIVAGPWLETLILVATLVSLATLRLPDRSPRRTR